MAARPLGTSGSPSRRRVATAAPPPMNRATTLMERTKGTAKRKQERLDEEPRPCRARAVVVDGALAHNQRCKDPTQAKRCGRVKCMGDVHKILRGNGRVWIKGPSGYDVNARSAQATSSQHGHVALAEVWVNLV
eukprot:CAMPEP_0185167208 /NCGR_PEP_ID=MMETSP1139-20130426/13863_1 /TAXON_ID=298111 /ORGANISM="Pavlova sp., Strain CCMP459" /LENGTH=133 /DNA_ID=CAMNT_0027732683 /DNA_START=703 /DNA_END=1106 /DNA_ORIENTATION=+